MLPHWAQLLDLAARLCPVSEETRRWFARFTRSAGVDDAKTIMRHCDMLRTAILQSQQTLIPQLERKRGDAQAPLIIAAWQYSLDTLFQEARSKKTCSWQIAGADNTDDDDRGEGDITLRRV